jgi:type II secretory pathway pseudopilin PulG
MRVNEQGRSMIEMLGVLAIVGVLSVGGIAGYSKAMTKFKTNKVIDQVNMLSTNIRTMFSSQRTFNGLNNTLSNTAGITPAEMIGATNADIINGFGGTVHVGPAKHLGQAEQGYVISFGSIPKAACVVMATTDWGGDVGSGFAYFEIDKTGTQTATAAATAKVSADDPATGGDQIAIPGDSVNPTPMTIMKAQVACGHATNNVLMWKYI